LKVRGNVMPFIATMDCHCCAKASRRFHEKTKDCIGVREIKKVYSKEDMIRDMWHCKDCWEKHHNYYPNGVCDWEDEDEYLKKRGLERR